MNEPMTRAFHLILIVVIALVACRREQPPIQDSGSSLRLDQRGAATNSLVGGQDQPKVVAGSAFFAFADSEGEFLFVPEVDTVAPGEEYFAIVQDRALRLDPQGPQPGDTAGNGRQNSWNVLHERGYWFRTDTVLARDEDVLIVSGAYLQGRKPLAFRKTSWTWSDTPAPSSPDTLPGMLVDGIWRLADMDGGGRVEAVLFSGRSPKVAGLAVRSMGTWKIRRIPGAAVGGDSSDTWREGDGGMFHPAGLEVLAAIQGPAGLEVALNWSAEEGSSLTLSRPSFDTLETVASAYRYLAPQ